MPERVDSTWHRLLWLLGWPVRKFLILLVRGYQKWISPSLAPSCRYYPCCSSYAVKSLERHGAVKGLLLTSWRVLKCNPLTEGGVNPVPDPGRWRASVLTTGQPRDEAGQPRSDDSDCCSDWIDPVADPVPAEPGVAAPRTMTESTTGA